jgi:PAP2 superfamily
MNFTKNIVAFSAVLLLLNSCGKEVNSGQTFEIYKPASLDENGGDWKTIVLPTATTISVPAPAASTDAAFLSELADLKAKSANLTTEQAVAVKYWGANSVARWNEIACELMAKYNLPPAYDPVLGKYPAPDATKPDQYPLFPFANPPYASRGFAHWSVAQFDALIACWNAKKQYGRKAPYTFDALITVNFVEKNDLPSYPSEDAVVAAVSRELLSWLFPNEKIYLLAKADECKNARIWAGANVISDIAAGDSLGRKVALKIIARGKTDKMGQANNQTIIDSIRTATVARGEMAWASLETPARPPMLPAFGLVKPWFIPSAADLRPAAPLSTNSAEFKAEMEELRKIQSNLTSNERKIANFWGDGPSTYTPPGHWNRTVVELCVKNKLNLLRTARAFAYVNTAMADGGIVCWNTKYFYFNPRPSTFDPSFKTSIGVPNFPSYISGHSTFSAAAAAVLGHIFPSETANLDNLANEASDSRVYGGIHYRSDCKTGLLVGKNVANYSIDKARADGAE